MKKIIKKFVAECDICQCHKSETVATLGLLHPLPNYARTDISMDFIDGLPSSQGKTTIFVVMDRLTKYTHFYAIRHPYTAASVTSTFIENIVKLHGVSHSNVSDRDKVFINAFWTELFRLQGTQLNMSTAYHPQTDVQTKLFQMFYQ